MRWALTPEQVRAAEAPLLAAGVPLMQRAAAGLATHCLELLGGAYGREVVVLAGAGSNGADALWAGARLARRGARVTAVPLGQVAADALSALHAAGGRTAGRVPPADLVLDGLVGIGGRGPLRPAAAALVEQVRAPLLVAVDVPSGVDAATGAVEGPAVRADVTVTFGALKPGLLLDAGKVHAGRVVLVDVGLGAVRSDVGVLEVADVRALLPSPGPESDKYRRGVVGVAAGSPQYTGAAVLCTGAAVRAGAGMVRFAGAEHPAEQVRLRWPEVVVTPFEQAGRVQAWVVGPGLGTDGAAERVVEQVLGGDVPVLVDADALTVCARRPDLLRRAAPTLLTPHAGEFARFGEEVGPDRLGAARGLAARLGVHVLLKGDATVVAAPDGRARVNATGTAALATAGSGDVLAGATGALLAQGMDALDAAAVGAHLHGRAGALAAAGAPTHAAAVLEHWPAAVREALAQG